MARVEIFQPKANNYARGRGYTHVQRLVTIVTRDGKRMALRYTGNTVRPSPTGELARSIRGTMRAQGQQVTGRVQANDPKGLVVHSGAKPHRISPRGDWPMVFFWKLKGRKIKTAGTIHHPGMQGKFFLTVPLSIEGRRLGFRVVLSPHTDRLYR